VIFEPSAIAGAYIVEPDNVEDERGFFARTYCAEEFADAGLADCTAQSSISFNRAAGTLRGLHYQLQPPEAKLVRCTRGRVFDVIADLRADSPTFRHWEGIELTEHNRFALYVPPFCAHGYYTLEDGCELLYQMSAPFDPAGARGVRWDDPSLAIVWPGRPIVISARDRSHPDLVDGV
jgi:dTDP-4-dehydrorhamnose 3,5-epimerase